MKKNLLLLSFAAILFSLSACNDDDKPINQDELPVASQTFLNTYFPGQSILDTRKDNNEYEVYYTNYKVEFDQQGDWKQIDGKRVNGDYKAIPQAFMENEIPTAIVNWVTSNYPNISIVEVEKEFEKGTHIGYDIELSNGIDDLDFDLNGNLIKGANPSGTVLPEKAQTFLSTYFPDDAVVSQKKDDDGEYEVVLTSGIEIDFDSQGTWKNIDGKFDNGQYKVLPETFLTTELPSSLLSFVTANYLGKEIIEVDKEYKNTTFVGYEIDLNGNIELDFDTNGNLIGSGGTTIVELPQTAKEFMNTHFNGLTYTSVKDENEFDVYVDAYKIEFDQQGVWKQVDGTVIKGNYKVLPESFLRTNPLNLITDYLTKEYPNNKILDIEKEYNNGQHTGYEFTLDNQIELKFDLTGMPILSGGGSSVINKDKLPQTAQTFLDSHFGNIEIRYIKQDEDEYEVYLNGYDLEFDLSGNWTKVDGYVGFVKTALPESFLALVPVNKINDYVSTNYPGRYIVEIEKDYDRSILSYDIELDNRVELVFNTEGEFTRKD
jgi:hypothetical protein